MIINPVGQVGIIAEVAKKSYFCSGNEKQLNLPAALTMRLGTQNFIE